MPKVMPYTIWYAENAAQARLLANNTALAGRARLVRLAASRREFPSVPRSLQQILYLDRPDIIVTHGPEHAPLVAVEMSAEAPTGHDSFQRFARVSACASLGVPFAYLLPERKWVQREGTTGRWDIYNPLIFEALLRVGRVHQVPVLGVLWSADKQHGRPEQGYLRCLGDEALPDPGLPGVRALFDFVDEVIRSHENGYPVARMLSTIQWAQWEQEMRQRYHERGGRRGEWSPLSACKIVETSALARELKRRMPELPEHLKTRKETVLYMTGSRTFRGDPYAGALVAIDYLCCREGPAPMSRRRNLGILFPSASMRQLTEKCRAFHQTGCPLSWPPDRARASPYYTLHLRDGCRYTKQKEIRIICYFADFIVFEDGIVF